MQSAPPPDRFDPATGWRAPEAVDFLGLVPAAGVLAFAGWLGSFHGAVVGSRSILGHGLLIGAACALLACLVSGRGPAGARVQPRRATYLLPALLALALPWAVSPVPRAGSTALILAPAYALLPLGVFLCWSRPRSRLWGIRALSAVTGTIAAWALISWRVLGTDGASLPLGHHNPLALCLVALLPLAVLPAVRPAAAEPGPSPGRPWRILGGLSGILAVAAIFATRSLAGAAALAAQILGGLAVVLVMRRRAKLAAGSAASVAPAGPAARRLRGLVAGGGLLLGVLAWASAARLGTILDGADASVSARITYGWAAWRGFLERPLQGWGPGSSHWTLAEHLRPVPGVNPPGQVVAEPHNLPLMLLYELGLGGTALLVLAAALLCRPERLRDGSRPEEDPADALRRAAGLGLSGLAVGSMGGMPPSIPALPLVALVLVGAFISARAPEVSRSTPSGGVRGRSALALVGVVWLAAVVWVLPARHRAHLAADRGDWRRAAALDPSFPFYGWRVALESRDPARAGAAAAGARGLAALWLTAGLQEAGDGRWAEARTALERACDLDPLGAVAPYFLATGSASVPGTLDGVPGGAGDSELDWAARALLAAPVLMAAEGWPEGGELPGRAVSLLAARADLPAPWRRALEAAWARVEEARPDLRSEASVEPPPAGQAWPEMAWRADQEGVGSLAVHAFRRGPQPATLARIPVDPRALPALGNLGPASELPGTPRTVFARPCRLGPELVASGLSPELRARNARSSPR